MSLIVVGCNMLKQTNDALGHEYGDLLLRRVACVYSRRSSGLTTIGASFTTRSFKETLSERCVPVRTGGDEFLIFCPGFDADAAEALIGELRRALAKKGDDVLVLDVVLGYHAVEDDSVPFAEALALADRAIYEDKRTARDTA